MTAAIDTLSDWRFWTGIVIAMVLLGWLVAYLLREDDNTPVQPPKGNGDAWRRR
jgi:hypothetical protein